MNTQRFASLLVFCLAIGCGGSETSTPATTEDSATEDTSTTTTDSSTPTDSAIDTTTTDTATTTDSMTTTETMPTMCMGLPDGGVMGCNMVVNSGTDVTMTNVATDTPTGTGGTIANGRYTLTKLERYNGSPLPATTSLNQTLEICDNFGMLAADDKTSAKYKKNFTFSPMGTDPKIKQVCSTQFPNTEIPYASYTATAKSLTIYSTVYKFSATYTMP